VVPPLRPVPFARSVPRVRCCCSPLARTFQGLAFKIVDLALHLLLWRRILLVGTSREAHPDCPALGTVLSPSFLSSLVTVQVVYHPGSLSSGPSGSPAAGLFSSSFDCGLDTSFLTHHTTKFEQFLLPQIPSLSHLTLTIDGPRGPHIHYWESLPFDGSISSHRLRLAPPVLVHGLSHAPLAPGGGTSALRTRAPLAGVFPASDYVNGHTHVSSSTPDAFS